MSDLGMPSAEQVQATPPTEEGLAWIAEQDLQELYWIPGVSQTNVAAAAVGNQQAVAYLRQQAAEHFEAAAYMCNPAASCEAACLHAYRQHLEQQMDQWPDDPAGSNGMPDQHSHERRMGSTVWIIEGAARAGNIDAV